MAIEVGQMDPFGGFPPLEELPKNQVQTVYHFIITESETNLKLDEDTLDSQWDPQVRNQTI